MTQNTLDYIIIGPAYPFRGGISDTQHQFAKALQKEGKKVKLFTFTKLYPKFIFPGKSQLTIDKISPNLNILPQIHAFNPLNWRKIAKKINSIKPKQVVFRYYTPFLAPAYGNIAKHIDTDIKKIALVDNWRPHEKSIWDTHLNLFFGKKIDLFTTLSENVANQLNKEFLKPIWAGFHPIPENLPELIPQKIARNKLKWDQEKKIVLFYGLIRKYKGVELLIKSFAEEALLNKNFSLYIAGECYENSKKYTDLVNKLNLNNRVRFDFTFQSIEKTQLLFSAADCVAQTYHSATQSGVTPLSYFYEKPLLVSDIDGLRTPVIKDKTGICTGIKTKLIAQNLSNLLKDENLSKFQKNILKNKKKYQWNSFVKKWDSFIIKNI